MKVPPIAPHRGPLTEEEKERARLLNLQRVLRQFSAIEKVLRDGGQVRAADMWRRYLDGVGDAVVFSPSEIRAYDVMKDAEQAIDRSFVDWMKASEWEERIKHTARGPQIRLVKTDLERLSPELLAMKDGETKFARSNWDRKLRYPSYLSMRQDGEREDARDLYGFLGEAQLSGNGGFKFTRHGDTIEFDGTVVHGFNEPFNFETGRNFPDPSASRLYVSGADGELLQRENLAREFDMRSQWSKRVQGRLKVDPTGKLILDSDPVWTDIDPSARWP